MKNAEGDFAQFITRREMAATAYVNGNADPLKHIFTLGQEATFFGPKGDIKNGADTVWQTFEKDSMAFNEGSDNKFEMIQYGASGEIGFWVGIQRSNARIAGQENPVKLDLRVTEIFRLENDEWRMIHRHADQVKE